MTTSALPPPRSSREWLAYFEINAHRLLPLPWEQGPSPTAEELAAIASSLQQFQLGESSEGQWLLRAAAEYAEQTGDPDYLPAIQLFIAEEQRHARDLGCYLTAAGVPLLGWNWVDGIFRRLRRAAPLEQVLVVLLTAEMIAKVYYRAIHQATGCPLLRSLCAQLLRDEVRHVEFHQERLALLRAGWSRGRVGWAIFRHRVLYAGTCLVVWLTHASAFRAGGFGFARFWREAWREFARGVRHMGPERAGACGRMRRRWVFFQELGDL
jgi:hypothetical protein